MTLTSLDYLASRLFLVGVLSLLQASDAMAGVGDCLKAALNTASPEDLKKSAAFAINHSGCLQNLTPPTLVPYAALSGSLDVANQSGALNQVGLDFGNSYAQCVAKVNPGKVAVKQLAPALKPVCSTLNMNCQMFEGQAAEEINAQLISEVPLLSLLPCSCAAATSGLGVERIAELVKATKQCGATLAQVGEVLGDAAKGVYQVGGSAVELSKDAVNEAEKLGESVVNGIGSVGCAISKIWGGCGDGPPPSAYGVGVAICKPRQGLWNLSSISNQPNDFSLSCNDGLRCLAKPGKPTQCMQGISKAQSDKAEADKVLADAIMREANPELCLQRGGVLKKGYDQRCHDTKCKTATFFVAAEYADKCTKGSNFFPEPADLWTLNGEKPFVDKFERLIVESIQRDPNASPLELLAAYDCRTFLGNSEQSLCKTQPGFDVCKKQVDGGKIKKCFFSGGGEYPLPLLVPGGLRPGKIQGASAVGLGVGPIVVKPHVVTSSPYAARQLSLPNAMGQPRSDLPLGGDFLIQLAQQGCQPSMERTGEHLCDSQAGFDLCVRAVSTGQIRACRNAVTGQVHPPTAGALRVAPIRKP